MPWQDVFAELNRTIASRAELLAAGAGARLLTSSVQSGSLLRIRRDHYALPSTDPHILRAVRVGGRLGCSSALRDLGIFGFDQRRTHIHLPRDLSRPRNAHDHRLALNARARSGVVLHWSDAVDASDGTEYRVAIVDALAQALRCNHPLHALASIENALFLGEISESDIGDIFARSGANRAYLRAQINARSEAGQETVLRSALRQAGFESEIQVEIPGIGRVDGVVEGRLIWEADSRLAHDGWELHVRDRDRDIDAASLGYMSLRPAYNRTMFATSDVVEAIAGLLAATRR